MTSLTPLAVALALIPTPAAACAVCIDTAWGARGFSWPFIVLMAAPFAVAAGLAGLVYVYARREEPPCVTRERSCEKASRPASSERPSSRSGSSPSTSCAAHPS